DTEVTVLRSDDPIRVYEHFATVYALSINIAGVPLGRGSFTESFLLFGYELSDYETLFGEKIAMFPEVTKERKTNWQGSIRKPLVDVEVYPKTEGGRLPVWVGVGGSPNSVIRAAHYGFDLMLAIIGGSPAQFAPFSNLFAQALEKFEKPMGRVG